jgi:hypothetical protein
MLELKCTFCNSFLTEGTHDNYSCTHCVSTGAGCGYQKDLSFYEAVIFIDNTLYKVIGSKFLVETCLFKYYNNNYKDTLSNHELFDRKEIFNTDIFFPLNIDNDFKNEIINLVNKLKRLITFQ